MNREPHLYDVHLFAVIRRKIPGISASTPHEAMETALDSRLASRWLEQFRDAEGSGEFADEISHFLVDVVGDDEFEQSRSLQSTSDPLLNPLRELVAWDEAGRDPAALKKLLADVRQILNDVL